MTKKLAGSFVNLVHEAAVRSFWRRTALARFLRQLGVADGFIAGWSSDESKRDLLDRLFARLPGLEGGQELILRMARDLAKQTSFPDLEHWEDSATKKAEAMLAVKALRHALECLDSQLASDQEKQESRARLAALQAEAARSQSSLGRLDERLAGLSTRIGTAEAGYDFQRWFYDLMDFFEISCRRPFISSGREIDGAITIGGTTYLVELKFTAEQADAVVVDSFHKKVTSKADNTMGVIVSMSGYSRVAVKEASGPRTPILLLDHRHVYLALRGGATFVEIVERVRRHASQTGEALLAPEYFGSA